jgi:hypothetical protein
MTAEKINTEKLFVCLDETSAELLQLIHPVDMDTFNGVPFANSWTAAQVIVHVIKSNLAIAKALKLEGKIIDRDPGERVNELKDLFLDFTIKFQSPGFILPPEMNYNKEEIIRDFMQSIEQLKEGSNDVNLAEAISHEAFGEITKLELLYFLMFNTQRHIHQLQNIINQLSYKKINSKL